MQTKIFGQGKHIIRFTCDNDSVEYRAHTLSGITRILRKVKRAREEIQKLAKTFSAERIRKDAMPYSYKWLVLNSQKCQLFLAGENDSAITFYSRVANHN